MKVANTEALIPNFLIIIRDTITLRVYTMTVTKGTLPKLLITSLLTFRIQLENQNCLETTKTAGFA